VVASHWWSVACRRAVVQRALRVGLIVGTILMLINHGDAILAGDLNPKRLLKMLLTYLVPYSVSTYASVSAIRDFEQGRN
jgi:hypothetical protein